MILSEQQQGEQATVKSSEKVRKQNTSCDSAEVQLFLFIRDLEIKYVTM